MEIILLNNSQINLNGEKLQKPKRNWKTKKRIDTVYEDCLNCGKELKFVIYVEATEFETKTGKPTKNGWDFVHGEAECKCGAAFLIADDYENTNIYWLNRKEMLASNRNKEMQKK
jgi:hypothetical protein